MTIRTMRLRYLWSQHLRNMNDFRGLIWKLVAHPDLSPEQLATIHAVAIDIEAKHRELYVILQEKGYHYEYS